MNVTKFLRTFFFTEPVWWLLPYLFLMSLKCSGTGVLLSNNLFRISLVIYNLKQKYLTFFKCLSLFKSTVLHFANVTRHVKNRQF